METREDILAYLEQAYRPEAIIVYGSFADGSANAHSDFDALVIAGHPAAHDATVVGGTVLDVFVYPPEAFLADYDPGAFLQVRDGIIVRDDNGLAGRLRARVLEHIENTPFKTDGEIAQSLAWCEKMLARTQRGDAEGFYRWHWLLADSLEIWCDAKRVRYFGPKKALRYMEAADPEAFRVYARALRNFSPDSLSEWIGLLGRIRPK